MKTSRKCSIAPPLVRSERPYSLQEVTQNVRLRERVRSIDLNTITFDTGQWLVPPDQVAQLEDLARALKAVIDRNPNEVYLIEGHTDAVGSSVDNLSLSDRRAEEVAAILTQNFEIPAENLVTQGYGEDYLKVNTLAANPENRRVTIRNITQLLSAQNQPQISLSNGSRIPATRPAGFRPAGFFIGLYTGATIGLSLRW